jgi:hypothetical protein
MCSAPYSAASKLTPLVRRQDYRKYTIPTDIRGKVFPMDLCGKVFPMALCGKVFPTDLGGSFFPTDQGMNVLLPRYSYNGTKEYFQ